MPREYRFAADLYGDWIEILLGELENSPLDFMVPLDTKQLDWLCRQYFILVQRLILPVPREVVVSRELDCRMGWEKRLDQVQRKAERGENLNPHLSKKICNPDYEDELLNRWGIHHLHLGADREGSFFVEREGPLLFARFDLKHAYLIDVVGHGQWEEEYVVEVVRRSWPDMLSGLKPPKTRGRTVGPEGEPSRGEGTGQLPDGSNNAEKGMRAESLCSWYKERLRDQEDWLRKNTSWVVRSIENAGRQAPEKLSFSLALEGNSIYIVEENTGVRFKREALAFPQLRSYWKGLEGYGAE